MLWLLYIAWWTDLVGLVPGARPDARLLPVMSPQPSSTQLKRLR